MINSAGRNLIWTAAHCLDSPGQAVFVPAYHDGSAPFGAWFENDRFQAPGFNGTNFKLDYGIIELEPNGQGQEVADVVGAAGVGFNQRLSLPIEALGYPTDGHPSGSDGETMVRCAGRRQDSGPTPNGTGFGAIPCDMGGGSSGGGWFSSRVLVSDTSFGEASFSTIFGPLLGSDAKDFYESVAGEPITCKGRTATIVGSEAGEILTGTPGADVIAARGGADVVEGGGGRDVICGGAGKDELHGGGANDTLLGEGGPDALAGDGGKKDRCDGGPGKDRAKRSCERKSSI